MNKLIVLAKNFETPFTKRLIAEVRDCIFFNPWTDPGPQLPESESVLLVRSTAVYGADRDLEFLRKLGGNTRIINPLKALEIFRTKKTQYEFYLNQNIPHLPWLDLQNLSEQEARNFIAKSSVKKFLIKPHRGQRGWGIRVFTPSEFFEWFQSTTDREFILQPYLGEAREYRYFFIGHHYEKTLLRIKEEGRVAANFGQAGKAILVNTPKEISEIVDKIKSLIDLDYGAIDILFDQGQYWVLEVNLAPGVEQLETVTRENVVRELLFFLKVI